ncbi:type I-C CRISPR-associated protein Cas8c/Csd1 [Camelimonas fluminis]|uniref:Type I-C CRISPR-associated protein Cas8c/Csd1 n=1 Tax=Camelimonas fluminis TaxID=1576911 RepID=A0ABV7UCB8_9HYPH|nr:type I-C CRISPR-associated protein Cas8c/Csd1 [Camelimonas fluminis]GHE48990.1 type I-C CRISPR-associated protein Cas8c/Csd1 [Camelimonas fluminis]
MTMLASLAQAYERRAARGEAPPFGFSQEKISWLISLQADGTPAGAPVDLREGEGRKRSPRSLPVPQPAKRTSGVAPNFLWDKTAYVLGVTAGDGKRTAREHAAFIDSHREWLAGEKDEGLSAFLGFLDWWRPARFTELGWPEDMKDQNVVFALESERLANIRIHDRPAAQAIWAGLSGGGDKNTALCLVSGRRGPVARLHPAIKGVWGAQSSGASIVSFNLDAFTSYGNEQGDNAPVSEAAAAAYTGMLNQFLDRDSGHRLQIGDASTVFWADGDDEAANEAAAEIFAFFFDVDDEVEAKRVGDALKRVREGLSVPDWSAALAPGVRFYVVGLAPNAARISVRFYIEDDFGVLAKSVAEHQERLHIEPPPRNTLSLWRMLLETATLRKRENIPPNLAGDWMRAILSGAPYPLTLLNAVLMRIRADHNINATRVAMLKSILIRNFDVGAPVALDPTCKDPGYVLGRLFAVYQQIQYAALGDVNASVTDKYYGAAAAHPRKVFTTLASLSQNHLSRLGKQQRGRMVNLERDIAGIMEMMEPSSDPFPANLSDKSQALFALGYYHQRNKYFAKSDKAAEADAEGDDA